LGILRAGEPAGSAAIDRVFFVEIKGQEATVLRLNARIVCMILGMCLPSMALAQMSSGSITGFVVDQTGSPVRGVKISATSPTQIGGAQVGYTNDEGQFRLRQLFPGTFEVRASAPKLRTVVQKDVKVGISAPSEVNIVMEVESQGVEEVKVVEKAPLVVTSKANLKETYDLDFVEATPHVSRDNIFSQLVNETPGGINGHVRGGTDSQTVFTQDGFFMRGQYPVLKSAAAFEVQSGGYGADNAMAAGGLVNLVTRTGSNKWELDFNAEAVLNQLVFFRDRLDADAGLYFFVINPAIAGPLIKDKLWFAFATESHILHNTNANGTLIDRGKDPQGQFPDPQPYDKFIQKGTLKLTWQMTSRNKLSALTNFDLPHEWNMINGQGVSPDAQQERQGMRLFQGVIFESLLSDDVVLRTQVGGTAIPQHIWPVTCNSDRAGCDFLPSIQQKTIPNQRVQLYGNNNNHERDDLFSLQFQNRLDWFVTSKTFGEHSLQLKDDFYTEREVRKFSKPGDQLIVYNGLDPESRTTYYSNDPRYEQPRYGWWIATTNVSRHTTTLVDAWKPTRYLTLTPGINNIWATASNGRGDDLGSIFTWAPTAALAWDATHDGRTVLRTSFNTYTDIDMVNIARHSLGSQAQQTCQWDAASQTFSKNCQYSGGRSPNTFGSPCGPTGIDATGADCHTKLKIPRTWEYTAGGEREVSQGLALSLDLVYKRFTNLYEVSETNQLWNRAGTDLDSGAQYRNGRNEKVMDLSTPDGAFRRYVGATVGLTKREGRVRTRVTYTWSRLDGTVWNDLSNPWGDVTGRDVYLNGPLPDDHRHEIKTNLVYSATAWMSLGVMYNYYSGTPYNRLFYNDQSKGYTDYRSAIGSNPGTNVNDPGDDRPLRLPDMHDLSAQVRVSLLPFIGQKLDVYANVLNVLGLRTTTSVVQNDTAEFNSQSGRMAPFRIRIGLNYRY
jgi:hypothetical protein